jgi:hypothetical protein
MLWEIETSHTPEDSTERKAQYKTLQGPTKQLIDDGIVKEWGVFLGQPRGYCLVEGDDVVLQTIANNFGPYVTFELIPIVSFENAVAATEAMDG